MILRKFLSFLVLLSFFFSFSFAAFDSFSLTNILSPFADLTEILTKDNGKIFDGIVIIITFIASFSIFRNILQTMFKGSGADGAKKGMSLILAIFLVGGLVVHNPGSGFVNFYSGLLLSFILLGIGIWAVIRVTKWAQKKQEFTFSKKTFYISLTTGLISILLLTLIYDILAPKEDSFFGVILFFLEEISLWSWILVFLTLFSVIKLPGFQKRGSTIVGEKAYELSKQISAKSQDYFGLAKKQKEIHSTVEEIEKTFAKLISDLNGGSKK